MILRSSFSRIHYNQNKRLQVKEFQYLIPTYSWTFTLIPNWICCIVTISLFNAQLPLRGLLTNLRKILLQSSSVHHMMKITKLLGYKTLRCINTVASLRERWTRENFVSGHNLHEQNFASHSHNLWQPLKQSLYMFRVVRKESLNMYPQIGWKSELKICFS